MKQQVKVMMIHNSGFNKLFNLLEYYQHEKCSTIQLISLYF